MTLIGHTPLAFTVHASITSRPYCSIVLGRHASQEFLNNLNEQMATRMSMMEEEVMSVRDSEGPCDPGKAPYPTEERDFQVRCSAVLLHTDILVKPI